MSLVMKLLRIARNIATMALFAALAAVTIIALLVVLQPSPDLALQSTPEALDAVFGFIWGLIMLLNLDRMSRMMPGRNASPRDGK